MQSRPRARAVSNAITPPALLAVLEAGAALSTVSRASIWPNATGTRSACLRGCAPRQCLSGATNAQTNATVKTAHEHRRRWLASDIGLGTGIVQIEDGVQDRSPVQPDDATLWIRPSAVVPRTDAFGSISDITRFTTPDT